MSIEDLKRALVEVKRLCAEREYCYDCPFGKDYSDRHICCLSPQLYTPTPENWPIDDWKEDSDDKAD